MEFANSDILLDNLPKAEETSMTSIDQRYFKVLVYQKLMIWAFVILGVGLAVFFYEKLHTGILVTAITTILALLVFADFRISYLSFLNKAFAIRDHDILYQNGWLIKNLNVIPFNRIQHCSVNSGVFERKFGLSSLKLFTAGGAESDILIPGLTLSQAASLRELVIQKNKTE